MDFWFAIVVIVAITSGAKVLRSRYVAQSRIEAIRGDSAETEALSREIASLNSRIAVLERIITDNRASHDLAHEIDRLRERT